LFDRRFGDAAFFRYTLYDELYAHAGCIVSEEDNPVVSLNYYGYADFRTADLKAVKVRVSRERIIWAEVLE
jgi:hypothetical protein